LGLGQHLGVGVRLLTARDLALQALLALFERRQVLRGLHAARLGQAGVCYGLAVAETGGGGNNTKDEQDARAHDAFLPSRRPGHSKRGVQPFHRTCRWTAREIN
jgi:hypothetical protein